MSQLITRSGSELTNNTAMLHIMEEKNIIIIFFLLYWIPANAQEINMPKENTVIVSMMAKPASVMHFHLPF